MKTHHPDNERVKRRYLIRLKEARRQSEASLDAVAKALSRFEEYTGHRDFKAFRIPQAIAFKDHLRRQVNRRTGAALSKATLYSTLNALRNFFSWLADEPGYKSRIRYSDAEYFNLSEKECRIATARRDRPAPTLEQIDYVLATMPAGTDIERRDRALIACTILAGPRDGALASLKIKHIDIDQGFVNQDAREVQTKASKTIPTWFFPVGDRAREIVVDWVNYLVKEKLWGLDDPLFPATEVAQDEERRFAAVGLARKHWSSAAPIRPIFRTAFAQARLPYFHPHSFRRTLALLGQRVCRTPEELKAWSQNLGHEQVMTTLINYGTLPRDRQAEIMRQLGAPQCAESAEELIQKLAAVYRGK